MVVDDRQRRAHASMLAERAAQRTVVSHSPAEPGGVVLAEHDVARGPPTSRTRSGACAAATNWATRCPQQPASYVDVSWVCGLRRLSFVAPPIVLSLTRKTFSPVVMSDS